MEVTIWHLKANYVNVDETIPYGQNARTQVFLDILRNIFQEFGHDVKIKKVRINHPLRKVKVSKDEHFIIHFNRSTIIHRGFLKSLKIFSNKILPNYFKRLANSLDTITVSCKVEQLVKELKNSRCVNVLVFDDIGACHLFKDISILKSSKNVIIYLSHDYYVGATIGSIKSKIKSSEEKIINLADLIVASSFRDLELYREGYRIDDDDIISFVNVFPPIDPPYSLVRLKRALPIKKEKTPTIALNIGAKVSESHILAYLREVSEAVSKLENIKILIVGEKLTRYMHRFGWGGNETEYMPYISSRLEFLRQLSRAHIGINYAYKPMGTNVKRFDFALAGLVVISRHPGSRGEFLPYEYVYVDPIDLKIKLRRLIEEDLRKMGEENRVEAINLARASYKDLLRKLKILIEKVEG